MKLNKQFVTVFSISVILLFTVFITITIARTILIGGVDFRIVPAKNFFSMGEPVDLRFEFKNNSANSVEIPFKGIQTGLIEVYLSKDGKDFRQYATLGWGSREIRRGGGLRELKGNSTYETSATMLWNVKPSYYRYGKITNSELDKVDRRILTTLPFSEPGTYFLKAKTLIREDVNKQETFTIESDIITILIVDPPSDEIDTWNLIKNEPEYAFFIQHGQFSDKVRSKEKRDSLLAEITRKISNRPNSFYGKEFKQSFEKFQEKEEKKEERKQKVLEKIQKERQRRN
jgi:hypothetical protein